MITNLIDIILYSIFIYMLYYTIVSIFGYFNHPEQVEQVKPQTKFLVLIPAVNEESVVSIPVTDMVNQTYPKELYTVVVVADHCTDNTAEIARKAGAQVITTKDNPGFVRHGIGKANTLDYGLHQTNWHDYDYMIVIDSDNNITSNFLQEMNNMAVKYHPAVMQSALKSKQGHGFINAGLNLSFRRSRRFQQIVESKYGCASIMGTGFATRIDVLEYLNGFRFNSLTEDAYEEIYTILYLNGSIKFVNSAWVTNENYSEIKQARKGLTRWSKGAFEVAYRMMWKCTKEFIKKPFSPRIWHCFCRMVTLGKAEQILLGGILIVLKWIFNYNETGLILPSYLTIIITILGVLMGLNITVFQTYIVLLEDYNFWQATLILIKSVFFSIFYQMCNVVAVLTFWKKQWKVSTHGK